MNKIYADIIAADADKINRFLENCPQLNIGENSPWERVLDAEKYALSAGGKRIRPVLAVEFYKMFSGDDEAPDWVYEAACTLEMTHTFSLIHDDMPEMDDDDLRRGKPATHVKYGNAIGLLSGDGLAILPYEIISQMAHDKKIPADMAIRLINTLSKNAGNRGMIAGQMLDLWSEDRPKRVDKSFLRKMSDLKTGCMLKASCQFGVILANAVGFDEWLTAAAYGQNVGLAFQIIDDVLDVTSSSEVLGKPICSDSERHKPTFADVLGIDGAKKEAKRLSTEAAELIGKHPRGALLREFALSLSEREK